MSSTLQPLTSPSQASPALDRRATGSPQLANRFCVPSSPSPLPRSGHHLARLPHLHKLLLPCVPASVFRSLVPLPPQPEPSGKLAPSFSPAPARPVSLKSVLLFIPMTTTLVDSPTGTHVSASSSSPRLRKPPAPRPPAPGPSPRSSEDGLPPLPDQQAPLFGTKAGWPDLEEKKNTWCPVELEFQTNNSFFSISMPPAVFAFPASVVFPGIAQHLYQMLCNTWDLISLKKCSLFT